MNNEETIIDPQYIQKTEETVLDNNVEQPEAKKEAKAKIAWGEKATYAVGGAVVGAGLTAAGQAIASPANAKSEEDVKPEDEKTEDVKPEEGVVSAEAPKVTVQTNGTIVHVDGDAKVEVADGIVHIAAAQQHVQEAQTTVAQTSHNATTTPSPEPEDSIVATATGIRVAQVDDDTSFAQAFADARAQVGPGGVFEWHGRAYSTYYKDEWDNMTTAERAEYQASINYDDVISDDSAAQHHNAVAQNNLRNHNRVAHKTDAHHAEARPAEARHTETEITSDDVEVKVLHVGRTDLNDDGTEEMVAVVEIDGHKALLIDIDLDGEADAVVADLNGDGRIQSNEIGNISARHIAMPTMSDGDAYMAQANSQPDYMDDADMGMYDM